MPRAQFLTASCISPSAVPRIIPLSIGPRGEKRDAGPEDESQPSAAVYTLRSLSASPVGGPPTGLPSTLTSFPHLGEDEQLRGRVSSVTNLDWEHELLLQRAVRYYAAQAIPAAPKGRAPKRTRLPEGCTDFVRANIHREDGSLAGYTPIWNGVPCLFEPVPGAP